MFWILHRTIFAELWKVFLLALVALTGILLLGLIFAEATRNGLGMLQILSVIPLLVFNTFPYTLPTTTLFATCIVYGRLAQDNEILAIKAAGIHLVQVVWPAVILGLLAAGTTFFLYMDIIPTTHHVLRTSLVKDLEQMMYSMLKRDGNIRHTKLGYSIFVKRVEGKKLVDAIFMRRDVKKDTYDLIARAREAELRVNLEKRLLVVHMTDCHITTADGGGGGFVKDHDFTLELPDEGSPGKTRASQMVWYELEDREVELIKTIADMDVVIADLDKQFAAGKAIDPKHIENLKSQRKFWKGELNAVRAEMHMRPSLAVGCLCFVLVACPVGIWFSKSDYLSAFITCFLPIVFVYYPLLLCGINFAKIGSLNPIVAIWSANALLAVIALILFRGLLKH